VSEKRTKELSLKKAILSMLSNDTTADEIISCIAIQKKISLFRAAKLVAAQAKDLRFQGGRITHNQYMDIATTAHGIFWIAR